MHNLKSITVIHTRGEFLFQCIVPVCIVTPSLHPHRWIIYFNAERYKIKSVIPSIKTQYTSTEVQQSWDSFGPSKHGWPDTGWFRVSDCIYLGYMGYIWVIFFITLDLKLFVKFKTIIIEWMDVISASRYFDNWFILSKERNDTLLRGW